MDGLADSQALRATVDAYLDVIYGPSALEAMSRAASLAERNMHSAIQRTLEAHGAVEVLTDSDVQDTSCFYEVTGPEGLIAAVYISTTIPYAAVLLVRESEFVGYVVTAGPSWPGQIISSLHSHGLVVLPGALCAADSPVRLSSGKPLTYFETLFSSVIDTPEPKKVFRVS